MKIVQYLNSAGGWGDVNHRTVNKGLGGRETALVHLGENWAKQGHQVINFVPNKTSLSRPTENDGEISYIHYDNAFNYLSNFETDVLVSWEVPGIFAEPDVRQRVKYGVVEVQVSEVEIKKDGLDFDQFVDDYFVLSNWAKDLFVDWHHVEGDKVKVLPNGVDLKRFPQRELSFPSPPFKFFYSSSPDRGLHHLLRMWPRILDLYPGSELHVAYGLENWANAVKWSHHMQSEVALYLLENIHQDGVVYHGKIGQKELAKIQLDSDALLYPCDTMYPTETGCITAIEAGASYSPMIMTTCDCLGSEFSECGSLVNLPMDDDVYLENIKFVMENDDVYLGLQSAGRELAESRSWDLISDQWLEDFAKNVN